MTAKRTPDFTGWASKSGLKCSDGRTIKAGAFKHQHEQTVPLVWQHQHDDPENVLGHAVLQDRAFGTYTEGFFNSTPRGQHMKEAVIHGDITSLSIYANDLKERKINGGREVSHGNIREVSLVLAGANSGAQIENVNIVHGANGEFTALDDEAIIHTGLAFERVNISGEEEDMPSNEELDEQEAVIEHADGSKETVKDVFETLNEKQKTAVYYMLGEALQHSDEDNEDLEHGEIISGEDVLAHINDSIKEGFEAMGRNTFDQTDEIQGSKNSLSHAQFATIMEAAKKEGTFKEGYKSVFEGGVLKHDGVAGVDYGITDLEFLFPDAKTIQNSPDLISRRMEWVSAVLGGTKHTPFAKVRSVFADVTADEARAKGFIKGNQKKDEVVKLLRRTTGPTTVYKKQKLDRDDMLDITDIDIVAWLKAEIRMMLEEEIARAILVGDGRDSLSEDKIKDPEGAVDGIGIRSILHDNEFYSHKVEISANQSPKETVKSIVRARTHYRGTGKPTLFVSDTYLTDIMLEEDKFGRALYETEQALADKLRVSRIITVDLFDDTENLFAILVNLADYSIGSNRGGELTSFEDFDIDFNQHKYLTETRISGALTKYKSAIVITRSEGTQATVTAPSFDGATNTLTIPSSEGVVYAVNGVDTTAGQVVIDDDVEVEAYADEGYYIRTGATRTWTYSYNAG